MDSIAFLLSKSNEQSFAWVVTINFLLEPRASRLQ
jgi:hypothetical protein